VEEVTVRKEVLNPATAHHQWQLNQEEERQPRWITAFEIETAFQCGQRSEREGIDGYMVVLMGRESQAGRSAANHSVLCE
jgi:hypothetical protein